MNQSSLETQRIHMNRISNETQSGCMNQNGPENQEV